MIRFDRSTVEDLFRDGHFRVLICTATLAWGVNLPAHTVIIRGTEVYDPKRGGLVSISVLDVMQIFGRAGRPQYDTSGHGIIISDIKQVSHYLRLIAHALPIESTFQSRLSDHLNAEIHAGTVTSIAEGVRWLEYTYLWQRIRINPLSYGLTIGDVRRDPELRTIRSEFISNAAAALNEACMVRFNPDTGALDTTDLGRIASHYYIEHISIRTFNEHLRRADGSFVDTLDLGAALNIIASANEFGQLRARQEELDELNKIHQMLPARIRKVRIAMESADETSIQWKVTTLLKAYISRVPIDMHSLVADMNYIVQNGSRIGRALF
ncbi:MAG: helicase-related protein, partial [Flavobacteriaceae bacterium]|nr:helicase-related protein [Flavobacteriaceae bacterium]